MAQSSFREVISAAAIVGMVLFATSASAENNAEMMANTCAGCHGTDGASRGPATPTIASLSKEYFISSMQDLKSGARTSTVMGRIAKGYSEADIKAMADYFETKKFIRTFQKIDEAKAKGGKELAKEYCSKCHEKEGKDGEGVGVLAGQWLPYMQIAIQDFVSGKREMEKRQKKKFDALMADHGGIKAFDPILHYYANVK
jgi:sulfide dehydrogenase cytochrome subunit